MSVRRGQIGPCAPVSTFASREAFLNNIRFLAWVRGRARLSRRRASSTMRPMSDGELASALREIQRQSAADREVQVRRSSAMARPRHLSVKEQDARTMEQAWGVINNAIKLLSDPLPDTFLGRKTQGAFPNLDDQ